MLHILTVHWNDDRWVDIQLDYLRRHIQQPYKVYAFLNGVPDEHRKKFFYSSIEPVKEHAIKLNILADIAAFNSEGDDDLLMFIDGDAIPIGDVISFGHEKLKQYPLVAVQRLENNGDIQPHPCFCLTTIKFWKEIDGDWKKGFQWINTRDRSVTDVVCGRSVTDVGGNLLKILREKGLEWYPMRRSNTTNLHPVLFALYDKLVYHHGAGFREPVTRRDMEISATRAKFIRLAPTRRLKKMLSPKKKEIEEKNSVLSQQVFKMIKENSEFYRHFQE
jgi:hypothetical protein